MAKEFTKWLPDFSVDDATIDTQHKTLLDQLNALHMGLEEGIEKEKITVLIMFLDVYILSHLRHEEEYMEKHSYPHIAKHKAEHDKFRLHYVNFKSQLMEMAPEDLAKEVNEYLVQWWVGHIGGIDQKYHMWINENPNCHPSDEVKDYHTVAQEV